VGEVIIKPQHQRAINKLRERFIDDPRYLALIVGGSVAKGLAREDSDIDCSFVVSDEEWQRREAARDYWIFMDDICDYPGGYVEARAYSLDLLKEAAERGTEILRSQFFNAIVVFSHRPEIEEIVRRIGVFPEAEREEKLRTFFTLTWLWSYYTTAAERDGDPYLLAYASSNMAHFAGRVILVYNRMLFTSSKYLMRRVGEAPEKPENFLELMEEVVRRPCAKAAWDLLESVRRFLHWEIDYKLLCNTHIENVEWGWRKGRTGMAEW